MPTSVQQKKFILTLQFPFPKNIIVSTMDQFRYLSQTLWDYRDSCKFTDITLFCEDGSIPAHVTIMAPLHSRYGINFLSNNEVPEFLFLLNFTTTEVFKALKALSLN